MSHDDLRHAGFKERTRVAEAREALLDAVVPHGRTERVGVADADGRTVAEPLTAPNPVPNYDRAAMDGYAVRAADTFGASDRSPEILRVAPESEAVSPGNAVRVHTGSELPAGADAVVMVEHVEAVGDPASELEVFDAVAEGENVGPTGEDVAAGATLYEPGHRLRPSDLGLLKSVGLREVPIFERPTVGVVPTGEELVQSEPEPGEIVETNGLTVSRLVERWGGVATYRDTVTDDPEAIRVAIERDLTKDAVVLTGGSSVGERDYTHEVVDDLGEVLVHGVALKPGHPVALGVVEDTPVLALPGYPVACIVNAVQFLRPALKAVGGMPREAHPSVEARLSRKVTSEPGTRTFVRVRLDETTDEDGTVERVAEPTRVSGSGVLSSVALADGWVVVPESVEGYAAGDTVAVENWEWSA
ncbi:gephyrin-like molybdotransferase Glp [Halobium salinum]|uniref:Gephyrin-like molybdotransferase Glp n=1 Tax=Halobium salinum TaxID=1364940 RepID=A0ABD5P9D8_9EURY|nr:gephyrin-like molybdotransferase Glp [Halobium salinum]